MKDNVNIRKPACQTVIRPPVFVTVAGLCCPVGLPLMGKGEFGPLSYYIADKKYVVCDRKLQQRVYGGLSFFFFILDGHWARMHGVPGTPRVMPHIADVDGGGSLV